MPSSFTPRSAAPPTFCSTCRQLPRKWASKSARSSLTRSAGKVPVLTNVKTYGTHPVEYVWYCGGVPALMQEVKDFLYLDCLTVTGKTIGENLVDLEQSGWFDEIAGYLENHGLRKDEVLHPIERPYKSGGTIAVLTGNLAPEGAVMKARCRRSPHP